MRVIPVIDLKGRRVVRGIAGRRAEYQPVESCFASGAQPVVVARGLRDEFAFTEVYVADLDAIAGSEPAWREMRDIAQSGLSLIVDAGAADYRRTKSFCDFARDLPRRLDVVVGLESVESEDALARALDCVGPRNALFSLDLKAGTPIAKLAEWQALSAEAIVETVVDLGFERLIILDLAQVGMRGGTNVVPLCRAIRQRHPRLEIISGGGVRDLDDLRVLADGGCDAALVASALHDGRLNKSDVDAAAGL